MTAPTLQELIEEAQRRGFVGRGPVARHLEHAVALAAMLDPFAGRLLDLGSGGGLPGLVLATRFPRASVVLLDAQRRRCEFLEEAIGALQIEDRCVVAHGRAEDVAREPSWRSTFDLVTARSFGPPATTAECAAGFLAVGGSLVVTEPPLGSAPDGQGLSTRWPAEGLARLGLGPADLVHRGETTAAKMTQIELVSERWPRRVGVPLKRPLWKS